MSEGINPTPTRPSMASTQYLFPVSYSPLAPAKALPTSPARRPTIQQHALAFSSQVNTFLLLKCPSHPPYHYPPIEILTSSISRPISNASSPRKTFPNLLIKNNQPPTPPPLHQPLFPKCFLILLQPFPDTSSVPH